MSFQINQDKNQPANLPDSMNKSYAKIAFFIAIPAILLFYSLGSFRTLSSHEAYAVVPAQEMLESGDWIVPRFGGIPRLKKPPLAYWVIAATGKMTGLGVNELTARIPAAISAILLACIIGYWAKEWYGKRAGFAAGFIQLTSVYVVMFARKAEIDMMLCLLTTSALFLVANSDESKNGKQRFIRWTSIYLLLAISWLAKFHYSLAIVAGPAIIYLLVQKRYRSFLNLLNPVGLLLLISAVVIWPYLVMQQLPNASAVWLDETVGRAMGSKGKDPIWYYLPILCWMPLPWTPIAFFGGYHSFLSAWKNKNAREQFLWIWLLTVLLIVSVQPVKHGHYLMGCLPVFSLFACRPAARLLELLNRKQPLLSSFQAMGVFLVFATLGIGAALIIPAKWPLLVQPATILGAIFVVGAILMAIFLTSDRPIRGFYIMAMTIMASFILTYGWIMPARDHRAQIAQFARTVRSNLPEGEPLSSFEVGMDPVIYYLDSPVKRMETHNELEEEINSKEKLTLVVRRHSLPVLKEYGAIKHLDYFHVKREYTMPRKADWVLVELKKIEHPVRISLKEEESRD